MTTKQANQDRRWHERMTLCAECATWTRQPQRDCDECGADLPKGA